MLPLLTEAVIIAVAKSVESVATLLAMPEGQLWLKDARENSAKVRSDLEKLFSDWPKLKP
jgi:flagellar biosynthesis/type III secretory pathway M-ring protein FliF/YscJ